MEVERRRGVRAGGRDPRRDFAPGRLTLVEDAPGTGGGAARALLPAATAPGHRGDARPEEVESRRGADNCFRRRALPGGAPGSGTGSSRIPRSGRSSAIRDAGSAFPGLPGTGARSAGAIRRRQPGPAPGGAQIPNFRADSVNAATARSTCSGPCAADNCTRMRAFPSGTTG